MGSYKEGHMYPNEAITPAALITTLLITTREPPRKV